MDDASPLNSGSAYVFRTTSFGYPRLGYSQVAKLTAGDGAAEDHFGYSVAIDSGTVVVGTYRDYNNGIASGSVSVFRTSDGGATYVEVAMLLPSDAAADDNFGWSVAINGDTVVIGARSDDAGGAWGSGSAYVFIDQNYPTLRATAAPTITFAPSPFPTPEPSTLRPTAHPSLQPTAFGAKVVSGGLCISGMTEDVATSHTSVFAEAIKYYASPSADIWYGVSVDVSSGCSARRRRLLDASSELTIHYNIHTDTSAAVSVVAGMGELSPATFDDALDAVVPANLTSVFASVTTTTVGDPTLETGTFAPTTASPTALPCGVDKFARAGEPCQQCPRYYTTNGARGPRECTYFSLGGRNALVSAIVLCIVLVSMPLVGCLLKVVPRWLVAELVLPSADVSTDIFVLFTSVFYNQVLFVFVIIFLLAPTLGFFCVLWVHEYIAPGMESMAFVMETFIGVFTLTPCLFADSEFKFPDKFPLAIEFAELESEEWWSKSIWIKR